MSYVFIILGVLLLLYVMGQDDQVLATVPVTQPSGETATVPVLVPASSVAAAAAPPPPAAAPPPPPAAAPTQPTLLPIPAITSVSSVAVPVAVSGVNGPIYAVVGRNSFNEIYGWNILRRVWDSISGKSKYISHSSGKIVSISPQNEINFKNDNADWVKLPGELVQADIGCDGEIYGVNAGKKVYKYDPSINNWHEFKGTALAITQVSSSRDYLWILRGDTHRMYKCRKPCDPNSPSWAITQGTAKYMDADCDGMVWVIGTDGKTYKSLDGGTSWTHVPSSPLKSITSVKDVVIGTGLDDKIYSCQKDNCTNWQTMGGDLSQVG